MGVSKLINKTLKQFGVRLTRVKSYKHPDYRQSAYFASILALLSSRNSVNIVVVGANDGKLNDPVYPLCIDFPKRTTILLIEPQEFLIPILKENYKFHDDKYFYNGAVGPEGQIAMFYINPKYFNKFEMAKGVNWPSYRGPSGVSSTNKTHVESFAHKFVGRRFMQNHKDLIMENMINSKPLDDIIKKVGFSKKLDVLQVDVEGFDDEVIYNSNIKELRPQIIFYEAENLSQSKELALESYLKQVGYYIVNQGNNTLAVYVNP